MINTNFSCTESYAKEFNTVKAKVTRRLARIEKDFAENLPNGFQAAIEIDDLEIVSANNATDFHDPKHPYKEPTVLNLRASNGTSGSFCEVKMKTLTQWCNRAATGLMNLEELLNYLRHYEVKDDPMFQEIQKLEDVGQLLRRHHEWLRDKFSITVFAGGIRVPVTGSNGFRGEIRICFSALTAEEDVAICVILLRTIQEALKEVTTDDWFEYDLSALRAIPMVNFHLTMWDIHEVA